MNTDPGSRPLVLVLLAAAGLATTSTHGLQVEVPPAQKADEVRTRIEELGTTLEAAAMSGAITEEQAWEIWGNVVKAEKLAYDRDFDGEGDESEPPSAKANVISLVAPEPEQIRVIFQAEFLRRHLQLLAAHLDLDRSQRTIVGVLFDDYGQAYELASAPLKEGLAQYRSATMSSFIGFALREAGVTLDAAVESARRLDREEAAK